MVIFGIVIGMFAIVCGCLLFGIHTGRRLQLREDTLSASHNSTRNAIFLDYIEAMCESPDTPSEGRVRCIRAIIKDWRNGKQHP